MYKEILRPINSFLNCSTPDTWIKEAKKPENLPIILRDHLICELKAAQSALFLLKRYALMDEDKVQLSNFVGPYNKLAYQKGAKLEELQNINITLKPMKSRHDCSYGQNMIDKMVLLIREELHHFSQVLEIIEEHNIPYEPISGSRYAKGLLKEVRMSEPETLIDKLIISAFIEARSCERFAKIAPHLTPKISRFYTSLLRSEARHYKDYLDLAEEISDVDIQGRIEFFAIIEAELIQASDPDFKFHSGEPKL